MRRSTRSFDDILQYIEPQQSGCWLWTGGRNTKGYGQIYIEGRNRGVHRYVYQHIVGDIPDGMTLDHLCRERACCNPTHLEPVTNQENCRRGLRGDLYPHKDHCAHGHPLTGDNVVIRKNGYRRCRTCHAAELRRYFARKKVAHQDSQSAV